MVLVAIAPFAGNTVRERQAEGVAVDRRNGVYDRVPKLSLDQIQLARERIAQDVPKAKVARDLGVFRLLFGPASVDYCLGRAADVEGATADASPPSGPYI